MRPTYIQQAQSDASVAYSAEEYLEAIRIYSHLILLNVDRTDMLSCRAFARYYRLEMYLQDRVFPSGQVMQDIKDIERAYELDLVLQDLNSIPTELTRNERILLLFVKAGLCVSEKDFEFLFRDINYFLETAPNNFSALYCHARCLEVAPGDANDNFRRAIARYTEILSLSPQSAAAFSRKYYLYAQLYANGHSFRLWQGFYTDLAAFDNYQHLKEFEFVLRALFSMCPFEEVHKLHQVLNGFFERSNEFEMAIFTTKLFFNKIKASHLVQSCNSLFNKWLDKIIELKKTDSLLFLEELDRFDITLKDWENDEYATNREIKNKRGKITRNTIKKKLYDFAKDAITTHRYHRAENILNYCIAPNHGSLLNEIIQAWGDQYKKIECYLNSTVNLDDPIWVVHFINIKTRLNDLDFLSILPEVLENNAILANNDDVQFAVANSYLQRNEYAQALSYLLKLNTNKYPESVINTMIAICHLQLKQEPNVAFEYLEDILQKQRLQPTQLIQIVAHLGNLVEARLAIKAGIQLQNHIDKFELSITDINDAKTLNLLFNERNNKIFQKNLSLFAAQQLKTDVEIIFSSKLAPN